jgi:hypothetical protein
VATAFLLTMGSFIFMLSEMHNIFIFGMLNGISAILGLVCELLLGPAVLIIAIKPKKRYQTIAA